MTRKVLLALAIFTVIGDCKDEGGNFFGTWGCSEKISKNQSMTEIIVVVKTSD